MFIVTNFGYMTPGAPVSPSPGGFIATAAPSGALPLPASFAGFTGLVHFKTELQPSVLWTDLTVQAEHLFVAAQSDVALGLRVYPKRHEASYDSAIGAWPANAFWQSADPLAASSKLVTLPTGSGKFEARFSPGRLLPFDEYYYRVTEDGTAPPWPAETGTDYREPTNIIVELHLFKTTGQPDPQVNMLLGLQTDPNVPKAQALGFAIPK